MKMNNNMIQELNDTQLDMVNGGGLFDMLWDKIVAIAEKKYYSDMQSSDSGVSGSW